MTKRTRKAHWAGDLARTGRVLCGAACNPTEPRTLATTWHDVTCGGCWRERHKREGRDVRIAHWVPNLDDLDAIPLCRRFPTTGEPMLVATDWPNVTCPLCRARRPT